MSHPSWVCGLKQQEGLRVGSRSESHPSWVCGLKRSSLASISCDYPVTPFVGVWIETYQHAAHLLLNQVTPFVGVWIETKSKIDSLL